MEEQDRIEAKRAKNFIWSAAQCYDFEPLFLAFSLDGTADIYLNLIIGLCYKWYNREKMEEFFEMLNGKNQETLEGLFWIGLENAVYQKEQTSRSSLKELRKEYAQETVRHYRSQKEYSLIDRIRNGDCFSRRHHAICLYSYTDVSGIRKRFTLCQCHQCCYHAGFYCDDAAFGDAASNGTLITINRKTLSRFPFQRSIDSVFYYPISTFFPSNANP